MFDLTQHMPRFGQSGNSQAAKGRSTAFGSPKKPASQKHSAHRPAPDLRLESGVLGEAAVLGLVEEWVVPMVADRVVRDLLASAPTTGGQMK